MKSFDRALAHSRFAASFAVSKVLIFGIPLLIAKFAAPNVYGAFEFAQAMGLFFGSLLVSPILSGLNHIYLTGRRDPIGGHIGFLQLGLLVICLPVFAVAFWLPLSFEVQTVVAFFPLAVAQSGLSTLARAYGRRTLTAWADGTATLLVGVGFLIAAVLGDLENWFPVALIGLASVVGIGTVCKTKRVSWYDAWSSSRTAFALGLPMTAIGAFAIWLSSSGRVLVGLVSASDVAAYGIAFRIVGFSLGVHQLASTALFGRLYVARAKEADRLSGNIMICVAAVALMLVLSFPVVIRFADFSALRTGTDHTANGIAGSMGLFFFMWSGFGWLQLRLNRTGLARRAILPMLIVSGAFAAVALGFQQFFSRHIVLFCWLIAVQSALYFLVAWMVLARAGLPQRRIGRIAIIGTVTLTAAGIATASLS
jgi:hypothetical protein